MDNDAQLTAGRAPGPPDRAEALGPVLHYVDARGALIKALAG